MPHDANGKELKVGDRVYLPCVIESLNENNDRSPNVTVRTEKTMSRGEYRQFLCDSNQTIKPE